MAKWFFKIKHFLLCRNRNKIPVVEFKNVVFQGNIKYPEIIITKQVKSHSIKYAKCEVCGEFFINIKGKSNG